MIDKYEPYKRSFGSIDLKDLTSLRKWFLDNQHLSVYDLAQIMGKCTKLVRELRIKAGIIGRKPSVHKPPCRKTIGPVDVPVMWKDKEWLTEALKKYSASSLIRSLGVSRYNFYTTLKSLSIPVSSGNTSKNSCCTKAWVYKHYVELQMTMNECAQLAGITRPRFADWLVKFNIPVRTAKETVRNINLPLAVKQVIRGLESLECVRRVDVRHNFIKVNWIYSKPSRYCYGRISPRQWRFDKIPQIYAQYECDLESGEGYPAHFIIKKKDMHRLSVFEREATARNLNYVIRKRNKWIWPSYPLKVLQEDLAALKDFNLNRFLRRGMFISTFKSYGYKILIHFFSMSMLRTQVFGRRNRLVLAVRYLLKIKRDVTFLNILMALRNRTNGYKHRMPSPSVYAAIMKRLGITGPVLDMHTGTGSRAVACALLGLPYRGRPSESFNKAIELGLGEFIGLRHEVWDGKETVDLVICDIDFAIGDISLALSFANRAQKIMAYVPYRVKNLLIERYQPSQIIPIINGGHEDKPNYYFVW